jgi:hypothetical protein
MTIRERRQFYALAERRGSLMCKLFFWALGLRILGELGFDVEYGIGRLIDRTWELNDLWDEMVELNGGETEG